MLTFATLAYGQDEMIVRVYSVQDLEYTVRDFKNSPRLDLNSAMNKDNNILRQRNSQKTKKKKSTDDLIALIKNTIEPDIWYDGATISYFRGTLVIFAPKRVHDQL